MDNLDRCKKEAEKISKEKGKNISYGYYMALYHKDSSRSKTKNRNSPNAHKTRKEYHRLTDKDVEKIAELHNEGYSISEIASKLDVSNTTVRCQLQKLDLMERERKFWNDEAVQTLQKLYFADVPKEEIAKQMNISKSAVSVAISKFGLAKQKKKRIEKRWWE